MPTLTVAVVGKPANPYEIHEWDQPWPPYDHLQKVDLQADEDEAISSVLGRAVEAVGVARHDDSPFVPAWINFYRSEHDHAYTGDHTTAVTLVDDQGRAHWDVWFQEDEVTVGALIRAAEAGTLDGDPLRPYPVSYTHLTLPTKA